jgi:hypothetical protein
MMQSNLERVKANARQSNTEDLLDRVTVFRPGMDSDALAVIEEELRARGITAAAVRAHDEQRRSQILPLVRGLPARCDLCPRPAVTSLVRWHRVWGVLPIFPRRFHYCDEHRPADLYSTQAGR